MASKRFLSFFCLLLLGTMSLPLLLKAQQKDSADNQFTISAQLRPRLEIRDGAFRPLLSSEKTAGLISERIRLSFYHKYKDLLEINISPQAVNIWGQANMVHGAENGGSELAFFEAWAKLKLSSKWNIKIGRQVISLDDERFFGELDWAQGGRAHDAVAVQYKQSKLDIRGYVSYNQNYKMLYGNNLNNPSGNAYSTANASPHKWMQAVWTAFQLSPQIKLTALATNLGLQNASLPTDSAIHYTQTVGANFTYQNKHINASLTAYYQTGKNIAGRKKNASLFAGYIGTNLNKHWQLGLGSDFVSGNDIGVAQNTDKSFTPFFHTGHKFYGAMDYFYAGNGHQDAGLSDTYMKLNYTSSNNYSLSLAAHHFSTPNTIAGAGKNYQHNLGQEIDLAFTYTIHKYASLVGGYSFYLANATIKYLKNTVAAKNYQQWAWLSININTTIFSSNF